MLLILFSIKFALFWFFALFDLIWLSLFVLRFCFYFVCFESCNSFIVPVRPVKSPCQITLSNPFDIQHLFRLKHTAPPNASIILLSVRCLYGVYTMVVPPQMPQHFAYLFCINKWTGYVNWIRELGSRWSCHFVWHITLHKSIKPPILSFIFPSH